MSWVIEHLHRDGSVLARIPVSGERFRIGRALNNDLVLDDPHTAAHHAEITFPDASQAMVSDLGTLNGIGIKLGQKTSNIAILDSQTVRIGGSWIRLRSSAWALAPERPMASRRVGLWAMLALLATLAHALWETWLTDLHTESPPYLYALAGVAALLAIWSAAYALYGRLADGADRFFNHLLIACCGYLGLTALDNFLSTLAFASGWVWPLQWQPYLLGLALALTVRAHLRTADLRHWPSTRWALAVVTVLAMAVPLAQQWISRKEFTSTRTMSQVSYPAIRWAPGVSIDTFLQDAQHLQNAADEARSDDTGQVDNEDGNGDGD